MSIRCLVSLTVLLTPLGAFAQPRLDKHGFPLPDGAIARLGDLHFAQPGTIETLAMSPDGKFIASSRGKRIFLWNADTGLITRAITAPESVRQLAFSKDDKLLAGGFWPGDVMVWNVATGQSRSQWRAPKQEPLNARTYLGLRFIDNDRLLAVVHNQIRVQLWEVEKGTPARAWTPETMPVLNGHTFVDVALSPSGEQMAWLATPYGVTTDGRCTVYVHETKSGKLLHEVKGLRSTEQIALVDEGQTLVLDPVFGVDPPSKLEGAGKYAVVSIPTGKVRYYCNFRPRYGPAMLGVFRIRNSLFTLDEIGMVRWDFETGEKLDEWTRSSLQSAWSADGKRTVMARGARLQLGDETFKPLQWRKEFAEVPSVRFRPDGTLITRGWFDAWFENRRRLDVWDLGKGRIVESVLEEPVWRTLERKAASYDADYKLAAYRVEDGCVVENLLTKKIVRLEGVTWTDYRAEPSLSSDGKRVLVTTTEKEAALIRWFDPRTGKEQGSYRVRNNEIERPELPKVSWYDEGKTVGYITHDGRWALVDCATRKLRFVVGIPSVPPRAKDEEAWSRHRPWYYWNANRFILAERGGGTGADSLGDREYAVWEAAAGQLVRRFKLQPPWPKTSHLNGHLSPDGRWLAATVCEVDYQDRITLYETATGRRLGELRAPNIFWDFDFAFDGKSLAMSCDDSTSLIWDLNRPLSGKPALPWPRTPAENEQLWQSLAEVVQNRRYPDGLLRAFLRSDPTPHHVLIEIATYPERRALKQALDDLALAYSALGHLPEMLMLVLRPKGKFRIDGKHTVQSQLGLASLRVEWRTVELWTLPAERFLAEADVGVTPWVPLMQMDGPAERTLEQCVARIEREAAAAQQGDMLAIAEVMTGLHFPGSELLKLFQGKKAMIESPVVQRWKAEAIHNVILAVLKNRFKTVPRDVTKQLREILDEEKLTSLNVVAGQCPNLDGFREALLS